MILGMDQQRCNDLLRRRKMKIFFYPLFPDFRNRVVFCKVLSLLLLVLLVKAACQWKKQHVSGNEYGAMVENAERGKPEKDLFH